MWFKNRPANSPDFARRLLLSSTISCSPGIISISPDFTHVLEVLFLPLSFSIIAIVETQKNGFDKDHQKN